MQKPFVSFLCIFLIVSLNAFTRSDYRTYYKFINRAELSIVKLKYDTALNIYKSVFSDYLYHDTKDLYNASICAIRSHDYQFASAWMQELMSLGYSPKDFKKHSFDSLPNYYKILLTSKYDSINQVYKSKIDLKLKTLIDSINSQEQLYFQKKPTFSYDSLVFEHSKILKKCIEHSKIFEVPMFEDHLKIPIALFRHHFGVMNKYKYMSPNDPLYKKLDFKEYSLKDLLLKAVMDGKLSPQTYMVLIEYNEQDHNQTTGKILVEVDLEDRFVKIHFPEKDQIKIINENRNKIGLECFEDAVNKSKGISALLTNYPFEEHLALAKKYGLSMLTVDSVSYEKQGEFAMESYKLQKKIIDNSVLEDFILPQSTLSFKLSLPYK